MKADLTRTRFIPTDHNRRLLFQQARVTLDAELNEQIDIDLHRDQVTTLDMVGAAGAPVGDSGFGLTPTATLLAVAEVAGLTVAVGQDATIITRTGGTFSIVPPPAGVTATLRAVSANAAGNWVAVGDGGTVVTSLGGAVSAAKLPSGIANELLGVWLGDSNKACVVGAGGVILTSPDAVSWTKHAAIAGVTGALRAVDFFDDTHGWAVGDAAMILQTTDGGTTWSLAAAPAGVEGTLRAVCALGADAAAAAAVGDGSTAIAIDASGAWASLALPAGIAARLTGASTFGDVLVACGERGTLLSAPVTSGQPGTWTALGYSGGADLRGIAAASATEVTAVGSFVAWLDIDISAGAVTPQAPPTVPGVDLEIGAGRYYVDGILVENDAPQLLSQQPDLPEWTAPAPGTYAAYLDVWERHLTAVEREELREVALGGPDTSTRARTVWQVRLEEAEGGATCALYPSGWTPGGGSTGLLRARANPAAVTTDDCMVPEDGGYRRLENQLYRVEIHEGGEPGTATFVWSRDNGSMLSRLVDTDPTLRTVTVAQPGRDDVIGFASATFVELSDEDHALTGEAGTLLTVAHVDEDVIAIPTTDPTPVPALDALGDIPTVRRWDGAATVTEGAWIELEDGVQIQFADGRYNTGDWWTIPARTLTAAVDWPQEDDESLFLPAAGITHHYASLGIVTVDASGHFAVTGDCRALFPPLTEATRFFGVGGDGQQLAEGAPGALPAPLEVGVMRGTEPLPGASVSFTVTDGGGSVNAAVAVSDGEGIASVQWTLGASGPQRVEARLLDPAGKPTDATPIHFNAMRLELGGGTCTVSAHPGDDLQLAADQLAAAGGGELCLAAGRYLLDEPVWFRGGLDEEGKRETSVTVSGRGASTVLLVSGAPCALLFTELSNVLVRCVAVSAEGTAEGNKALLAKIGAMYKPNPAQALGALTFAGCAEVTVVDCDLACSDGDAEAWTCISDFPPPAVAAAVNQLPKDVAIAAQPSAGGGLWVERCRMRVGAQQCGVLSVGAARSIVARNHITLLAASKTSFRPNEPYDETAKKIASEMMGMRVKEQSVTTEQVDMAKAKQVVNVPSDAPTARMWQLYGESQAKVAKEVGDGAQAFVAEDIEAVASKKASDQLVDGVYSAFIAVRAAAAGVDIVARTGLETAQVIDNVIDGCIVAVNLRRQPRRGQLARAIVSRNMLAALIPAVTELVTGAITASDVVSLEISGNQATLTRPSTWPEKEMGRTIGVYVTGKLGPYQVVRNTSLDGFTDGVVVEPGSGSASPANARLWLVAETFAANLAVGTPTPDSAPIVVAPAMVRQELNFGS